MLSPRKSASKFVRGEGGVIYCALFRRYKGIAGIHALICTTMYFRAQTDSRLIARVALAYSTAAVVLLHACHAAACWRDYASTDLHRQSRVYRCCCCCCVAVTKCVTANVFHFLNKMCYAVLACLA